MRVPQVSERIKEVPAQALRGVFAGIGQLLLITDKLKNKALAGQQATPARAPGPPETAADTADGAAGRGETPGPARADDQQMVETPSAPEAQPPPEAPLVAEAPPVADVAGTPSVADITGAPPVAEAPPVAPVVEAPPVAEAPQASERSRTPRAPKAPQIRDFDKTGNVRLLSSDEARAGSAARNAGPAPGGGPDRAAADATLTAGATVTAGATATEGLTAQIAGEAGESAAPLPNYDELSVASLRARLRNLDITQVRQLTEYEKAHAARPDVISMFERRIVRLEAEATAAEEARAEAEVEAKEEIAAEVRTEVEAEAEAET